jgi:O-antigen/teichoic acid export membrane protein
MHWQSLSDAATELVYSMTKKQTEPCPKRPQAIVLHSSRTIVNAGWNAFATLWGIAIAFVLAPILIHQLGISQYGILLLVWSFAGVLGIATGGLGEATLRYVAMYHGAKDMEGVSRVFGSSLLFCIIVCSIVCVVLFTSAPRMVLLLNIESDQEEIAAWLLRLAAVIFSIGAIGGAFAAVPMALQRYDISGKVILGLSVVRSVGYLGLAIFGYGIVHFLLWDIINGMVAAGLNIAIARRLLPNARLHPSLSFRGLREIAGYGMFSYLTFVFHAMYRESGKFVVAAFLGPAAVAFYGTPDSIVYRGYMVLVSGIETLMPRFSATKNASAAQSLVLESTWLSVTGTISVLVPLAVLMPDFLRLWINAEFARESAVVGQLVALAFVAPATYTPIATFLRGSGRPELVTGTMACAAILALAVTVLLVPTYGVVGIGYAYLFSSVAWVGGLLIGWVRVLGTSVVPLARFAGAPLLLGISALAAEMTIRARLGDLNWFGFIVVGSTFTVLTATFLAGVDFLIGGCSPSRRLWGRLAVLLKGLAARLRQACGSE